MFKQLFWMCALAAAILLTIRLVAAEPRFRDPRDGLGGFLWKPCSDHGCSLVVLFATRHQPERFRFCRVFEPLEDGNFARETLRYTGRANQDRPHYRASKNGADYDGRIVCRRKQGAKGRALLRLQVPEPSERQD
jgi:hypothetical protein